MDKDSFLSQPITPTITCLSCGETLLYGVKECRFCRAGIDKAYAKESVASQTLLTQGVKSANVIRSLRNLFYILIGATVLAFFLDPSYLEILLFISILNLIGPIKWLRKYRDASLNHTEVLKAQKDMKVELYLWLGAIILEGSLLAIWLYESSGAD